jgi:quercetin dioxygenase-like cupin family protein
VVFNEVVPMTMQDAEEGTLAGRAVDLARFSAEGFGRRVLAETDRFRVVVAALEDGQEIPLHAPDVDVVMAVMDGTGEVVAGAAAHAVRAGDVVFVPRGRTRGLRAIGGRLVAVNVASPPPGPEDHAHGGAPWPAAEAGPDMAALVLEEHAGLFPHLEHLGALAAGAGDLDEAELRRRLTAVLEFLRDDLLPHAAEEERSVYPAVEKVLRAAGGATRTMSIDHRFVGAMVEELVELSAGSLAAADRERARRVLYGLRALLEVHFTKENEAYVPLLNRLSAAERQTLFDRLSGGGHAHHHEEA